MQVEETRRRYTIEVEGLKAEVQLLVKEKHRHERDNELAAMAAAAAKKAAAEATDELEQLKHDLQRSRRELEAATRCAVFGCVGCIG